jgi:hypothetical protein
MRPTGARAAGAESSDGESGVASTATAPAGGRTAGGRPILPGAISEQFAGIAQRVPDDYQLEYRPALAGLGKVHFRQASHKVDAWRKCQLLTTLERAAAENVWQGAAPWPAELTIDAEPDDRGRFADLPGEFSREKSYPIFARQLKEHLYRSEAFELWRCEALHECSHEGETPEAFRARLAPLAAERLQSESAALAGRYAARLADAEAAIQRQQTKVRTERWQFFGKLASIMWVAVETVLRAIGRGRRGRPRSAEAAFRQAAAEHGQQATAKISAEQALHDKLRLEKELNDKRKELEALYDPSQLAIESVQLPPLKSDVQVDQVALVWLPWRVDGAGRAEPVY